jgi:hypothetical protein
VAWRGVCDPRLVDASLLAGLVVLTALAQPYLYASDTLVSVDTATQYYPWYAYLGQSLAAGRIPGWNPATFSGAPFAADPLSGWTYLPAMVFFVLFPLAQAAKVLMVFHPVLAGVSTYAFARAVGLGRGGAFVAGLAYANTGFMQIQNVCCSPVAAIYGWLPLTLLGVERALRSPSLTARAGWWGLAGLGVSQAIAVWPGQGAYYAALLTGGFIAYRSLVDPCVPPGAGVWGRMGRLLQHEACVFGLGAALAAAGLLPRIELNAASNLAGGYVGDNLDVGGLQPSQWVFLAEPGVWYVGISVLALAAAAPFVARQHVGRPLWYFGIASLGALFVTGTVETPLHWLLYHVLPGFASLHPHAPERILTVAYLGPALLAGAAVCSINDTRWLRRPVAIVGLAALVTADLAAGGVTARSNRMMTNPLDGIDRLTPVDLATYYQTGGAATFLQQHLRESPSRFLGYAPDVGGQPLAYTFRFADPHTAALLVNNHALPLGLQDVQGYDASHLRRYDEFLAALNGQTQDYHDASIFSKGMSSPLLDLLNTRYVVIPARVDAPGTPALDRFPTTVYVDDQVRILENPAAFPRAWIVHAAQDAPDGNGSVHRIAEGSIDARRIALLEETPPPLELPTNPELDQAGVLTYEADRINIRTSTGAAGLLVLSEIYYPAWKAYLDGQPVSLFVADGALRAVPVPVGEHMVELRFESETLRVGMLISGAATVLLAILGLVCLVGRRPVGGRWL